MGSPSDDGKTAPTRDPVETQSISTGSDEDVIPKGALDPVYEAKAKVLNHAVSLILASQLPATSIATYIHVCSQTNAYLDADSRDWHGMVSMATLLRRRLWLGF